MAAHNHWPAIGASQVVHCEGNAFTGCVTTGIAFERQFAAEHAVINIRQFQRHHSQAHAPLPGIAQQPAQSSVNVSFQVSGFTQAFCKRVFVAVVVAHLHRQRPHAAALRSHGGKQMICHAPQHRFDIFLVGHVLVECLLFAE